MKNQTALPSAKPASDKYQRRREEILLAAAAVFAEKGFHGCSTQDIADRLGMKQGSLYYYFTSKEAALEAVCLYGISESVVRLRAVLEADAPLAEKIQQVIHSNLYNLRARCDCMIVFTEQRRFLAVEQQEGIREQTRAYRALLLQLFEDALARGEMNPQLDSELAVRALTGLCGSVATWIQRTPQYDIDQIAQQYALVFLGGIQA